MSAIVGQPGTPRASAGMNSHCEAALFAATVEATASIAPLPNCAWFFDTFFSSVYAENDAIVGPAPGKMPKNAPTAVPRIIGFQLCLKSFQVGHRFLTFWNSRSRVRLL